MAAGNCRCFVCPFLLTYKVDILAFSAFVALKCKNNNVKCTVWAASGECESNPGYMLT